MQRPSSSSALGWSRSFDAPDGGAAPPEQVTNIRLGEYLRVFKY